MDSIDSYYDTETASAITEKTGPGFFTRGISPKKAMGIGLNLPPKPKDVPFYKRREAWHSPLAVLLIIGYAIYYVAWTTLFVLKWIFISPIRPFTDSKKLCKIGLHKYRKVTDVHGWSSANETKYKCLICEKQKTVSNS